MSEHLVRVERLKHLQRERGWNDSELARQCGRTPQQIRSWWSSARLIGERLARSLEEVLKLPRYWLDDRPSSTATLAVREGTVAYQARSAKVQDAPSGAEALPVVPWGQLKTMLVQANDLLPAHPRIETFVQASRVAKFVEMPDDSMEPFFAAGDHLLFDPAESPHAGDTVLVSIPSGELFVRNYKPKSATNWEASALNGNYDSLQFPKDGVEIVAVMVEHRRYRRRIS